MPAHPPRSPHSAHRRARTDARRRTTPGAGFTLIELLVVIAIIGILASIAVVLAGKVINGGKEALTQHIIKALDMTLDEYIHEREGAKVPANYTDEQGNQFALFDGRREATSFDQAADPAEPSLPLLLLMATTQVPATNAHLADIDAKFIGTEQYPDGASNPLNGDTEYSANPRRIRTTVGSPKNAAGVPLSGLYIKDGYGNPLRFVHPAYDGGKGNYYWQDTAAPGPNNWRLNGGNGQHGVRRPIDVPLKMNGPNNQPTTIQFRRSYRPFDPITPGVANPIGDADEGICVGGRAYFYSAGADGDPGTRDDNVYTSKPQFPAETADQK